MNNKEPNPSLLPQKFLQDDGNMQDRNNFTTSLTERETYNFLFFLLKENTETFIEY